MESRFGPPSEPVDVLAFVKSAVDVYFRDLNSVQFSTENIAAECSVSDIQNSLSNAWNNPIISARLTNKQSTISPCSSSKSKCKERFPDPDPHAPEVAALQKDLDKIELGSWKLKGNSALFMRSSKNAEQNAFAQATSGSDSLDSSDVKAIITVTVYDRLSWGAGSVTRASQHALLSSQTLSDVFDLVPCPPNGLAVESASPTPPCEEQLQATTNTDDCVICINGIAYGNGSQTDYADKLLLHLQTISKDCSPITKAKTAVHQTLLSALSLRVNQPYWLLHHGNCEHFIVVDQIRLQHPSDPSSGYPLMLQATPAFLDLCRACSKVPALVSVVGDVRLGESPCLMCGPCWRNMGDPQGACQIIPLLLPSDLG